MALDVDTTQRASSAGREQLVRAIAAANEKEPEQDALEWKRTLDLGDAKHRFDLARHILGMGNRAPRAAAGTFGGFGYLLVGVEPSRLEGVDVPDPGNVTRGLSSLIAQGHPHWHLHLVELDDVTVAVIEVDPPRMGDRICTLRKGNDRVEAGAIFVRRQGETGFAGPDEIRMLEERFATGINETAERTRREQEQRRLQLEEERAARERVEIAVRDAPKFEASPREAGFVRRGDEVRGMVRNVGASTAHVESARMYREHGGAVDAGMVVVYGSEPGEPGPSASVDRGVDLRLSFKHAMFGQVSDERLSIDVFFTDDGGLSWRSVVPLRRRGSLHGQPLWVIVHEQIEHRRENV